MKKPAICKWAWSKNTRLFFTDCKETIDVGGSGGEVAKWKMRYCVSCGGKIKWTNRRESRHE